VHIKNNHDVDSEAKVHADIASHNSDKIIQVFVLSGKLLLHSFSFTTLSDSREHILDGE